MANRQIREMEDKKQQTRLILMKYKQMITKEKYTTSEMLRVINRDIKALKEIEEETKESEPIYVLSKIECQNCYYVWAEVILATTNTALCPNCNLDYEIKPLLFCSR